METYPIDIDAGQVARWVKDELELTPLTLRISARRSRELRDIPLRQELHLGDAEREDLTEIDTVATLEIAPLHTNEGWLLSVIVEDEAGPRVSLGGEAGTAEQRIDPGTFYHDFIRPGRGLANVFAAVENDAAKDHVNRLISAIESNRHGGART
jgi:hypothetical protein